MKCKLYSKNRKLYKKSYLVQVTCGQDDLYMEYTLAENDKSLNFTEMQLESSYSHL